MIILSTRFFFSLKCDIKRCKKETTFCILTRVECSVGCLRFPSLYCFNTVSLQTSEELMDQLMRCNWDTVNHSSGDAICSNQSSSTDYSSLLRCLLDGVFRTVSQAVGADPQDKNDCCSMKSARSSPQSIYIYNNTSNFNT